MRPRHKAAENRSPLDPFGDCDETKSFNEAAA